MAKNISVLLVGESTTRLNALDDLLIDQPQLKTSRKLISQDVKGAIVDVGNIPDVLLLDLGVRWEFALANIYSGIPMSSRPPLIVIGEENDSDTMRKSMQAGARDYFTSSISEEELINSIMQIGMDAQLAQRQGRGMITSVINGKGGSGATFIATNLAVTAAKPKSKKGKVSTVVVVDMDLQFGDLAVYLDVATGDELFKALNDAHSVDAVAMQGMLKTHESGIQLLASKATEFRSTNELLPGQVTHLLTMLSRQYDHVILDLPLSLNPLIVAALEMSDQVGVVTQQTVPCVRDTRYLIGLLRDVGLTNNSIKLLVNRYQKRSEVRMVDLEEVFDELDIYLIPNDYKRVSFSINNGVPLCVKWPKCPVAKAFSEIVTQAMSESHAD